MSERPVNTVLAEAAAHLAFLATEALYAEQPELWERGEHGRFHTMNDFILHFRAVSTGEEGFAAHVEYSRELFDDKGFPQQWLTDAWRIMRDTGAGELDEPARAEFLRRLETVVGGTDE